jgi:hypothetical protein
VDSFDLARKFAGTRLALENLKRAIWRYRESGPYEVTPDLDFESGDYVLRIQFEPPSEVVELTGAVLDGLREGLDHLVYKESVARKGQPPKGERTQFPIVDCAKSFAGRKAEWLEGLSDRQVAHIERSQPYEGVDWTKRLRDMHNPDKHRHPVRLKVVVDGTPDIRRRRPWLTGKAANRIAALVSEEEQAKEGLAVADVDVQLAFALDITFSDGTKVTEALEEIEREVTALYNELPALR